MYARKLKNDTNHYLIDHVCLSSLNYLFLLITHSSFIRTFGHTGLSCACVLLIIVIRTFYFSKYFEKRLHIFVFYFIIQRPSQTTSISQTTGSVFLYAIVLITSAKFIWQLGILIFKRSVW